MDMPARYWNTLSPEDKAEFLRLRHNFLHDQRFSSKDRRVVTFHRELVILLKYIERTDQNIEERSILVGICFAGPLICVNTKQLKAFLGRCKSSINGSFQQMGYTALRTKVKARSCCSAVMPALLNDPNTLRQWTVRYASEEAQVCFLSSYSHAQLPQITSEDFTEEKKRPANAANYFQGISAQITVNRPIQEPHVRQLGFEVYGAAAPPMDRMRPPEMAMSQSMDDFSTELNGWDNSPIGYSNDNQGDWEQNQAKMTRSKSAFFQNEEDTYNRDFFTDF